MGRGRGEGSVKVIWYEFIIIRIGRKKIWRKFYEDNGRVVNFYKNYKACSNVTNRYEILKKKKDKKK